MAESAAVLVSHEGPITTLTVNRPDALNALNRETLTALRAAIDRLATRTELAAVVVTGAGEKAFVAGADIAGMSAMTPPEAQAFAELGQSTFAALEALEVPVIAAVN